MLLIPTITRTRIKTTTFLRPNPPLEQLQQLVLILALSAAVQLRLGEKATRFALRATKAGNLPELGLPRPLEPGMRNSFNHTLNFLVENSVESFNKDGL